MADGQNAVPPMPGFDINSLSRAFGSMNLGPLAGMLNNVNITQLLPLLPMVMKTIGGLGGAGGLGSLGALGGAGGLGSLGALGGLGGLSGLFGANPGFGAAPAVNPANFGLQGASVPGVPLQNAAPAGFAIPPQFQGDPRFLVLNTIKPFFAQDKIFIIDQIMRFLAIFLTISSILPKPVPVAAAPVAAATAATAPPAPPIPIPALPAKA
jgi:hypothetical protein